MRRYSLLSLVAALALPLSCAQAAVSLEFNNSSNNQVGGALSTIDVASGGTIVLSLQLVSTSEGTTSLDYWLSQFSGPGGTGPFVFSIMTRDLAGSFFPDPSASDATVSSAADTRSNTLASGAADGVPDNRLGPRSGFDLGSSKQTTTSNNGPGTLQVATFTLQILPNATPGVYQLRSFDYAGFGWSNVTSVDQPFANQAAININVIPEPATWSFITLGAMAAACLGFVRTRRRV